MREKIKPISFIKSFLIFALFGVWFYIVIKLLVPSIAASTGATEYIVWMFTGSFVLFLPMFAVTWFLLKKEGCKMDLRSITERLNFRKLTKKDILTTVGGFMISIILCGVIIIIMMLTDRALTVDSLYSISPIEVSPLKESQLWFALFLPVFFFFNYVGEETLWRGCILPRQLAAGYGSYAVIMNALFHCTYHFVFGWKPLVMMFPMMVLMPHLAAKTKNTWTSVIIHFLIGAPSQIMIILGIINH
ncbi:MAG: CPBP family intramembrane metalloprotease [Bacillota bacterium]|nr:CPBP family intramembrane metalloprotease [Bacillota bacterium]